MTETGDNRSAVEAASRALRSALTEDLALGRALAQTMRDQKRALVTNDAAALSDVERAGAAILQRQEANSRRRDTAARTLAAALGYSSAEGDKLPPLASLAARLPVAEAAPLLTLRRSLHETHVGLINANEQNRALAVNALGLLEDTFNALAELATRPTGYGASAYRAKAPAFYLDHRA